MVGVATIQFELVSGSGERLNLVFARVVNLLVSASRELEHSQEAAKTSIQQAASLLQVQMRCASAERHGPTQALASWRMRLVESYIAKHIDRPIPVTNLSALVGLSEAHFSRAFRLSYGESPHAYIVRRRVEFAAQLILAGRDPLSEIALKCGFHDQAHLTKQFRRLARLVARRSPNVAAVALANKDARVIWGLLAHGRNYQAQASRRASQRRKSRARSGAAARSHIARAGPRSGESRSAPASRQPAWCPAPR